MFYLFGKGVDRHQNKRLEQWIFQKSDTTYSLIRWKEANEFSISYSLNPGSSWGFLGGQCENKNGKWILKTDSTTMQIDNDKLIGIRNSTDTIKMTKVER